MNASVLPPPIGGFVPNTAKAVSDNTVATPQYVIAIGASAGGMNALQKLLKLVPDSFPWPIVIVQHLAPDRGTLLPDILARSSQLDVRLAQADDRLKPHIVYIAPPSHHLVINGDRTLALNDAPAVHFSRPSIDTCFKSLAEACGQEAIAIILTGANVDGADGIKAVKARGGLTIAQSPDTAEVSSMPRAAIRTGAIDHVLDLEAIADKLIQLAQQAQ